MTIIKATAIFKGVSISGLDTDALTFLNTAGILDATIRAAISTFVFTLKDKDIWDFVEVLYPIVGGDENKHSFNLKRPEKFKITWFNNPTHSANGVDYNGVNQYGATGFIPSTSRFVDGLAHGGVYQRETIASVFQFAFGATQPSDFIFEMRPRGSDDKLTAGINGQSDTFDTLILDEKGLLMMDRDVISPDHYRLFKNGVEIDDKLLSLRGNRPPTIPIFIGCRNDQGTAINFSTKQASLYTFGETLTATQHLDYFNAVQTLQTTLGRNV